MTTQHGLGSLDSFGEFTRNWFLQTFAAATEVQARGWQTIAEGQHALLVAPTGSGKTLAAFLAGIDAASRLPADAEPGVRLLYVSPLRALAHDVQCNLRAPLVGIRRTAERLGIALRRLRVDVRTGDTPQEERRRQAREPGEILVTTPESLYLILGAGARETLRTVNTVIVDEVHALAPNKRGAHLALSLERLCALSQSEPQRIGLSATVRPLDEVARYLGGHRAVEIVEVSVPPRVDLQVSVPVPDMENVQVQPSRERPGGSILGELYTRERGAPAAERGIWPAIYPKLLEQVRANRSTIIFVNSRGLCERLTQRLNDLAGEVLLRAHHGSVSREKRAEIEEHLKQGHLRGIVATSSLELGIDMGAVDGVILVESPGSVARGLQRVGRAGHQVDAVSSGRIFPKFRGDLLECAVIAERMQRGAIEAVRVPRNALDVLAQQIVAMCAVAPQSVSDLEALVMRAYPYRALTRAALEAVLDMLSGRYPSPAFASLKPLLVWDRSQDLLRARRGAAFAVRMNAGTIPDRGNYSVHLGPNGPRLGELDEEMVFETRPGENILLGASTWRVEEITRDRVLVVPAPGEPGKLPFWRGEGPGRPVELGRAVGAFVRELGSRRSQEALRWLLAHTPLEHHAARNLIAYIEEQRAHTATLPTDQAITVERFRDELGDWRVCILSPFGARVHAPWAMALQRLASAHNGFEIQVMYADDGIVLRFADTDELPSLDALVPAPEDAEDLVTEQLAESALFAGLFRENAVRSLLLPRRRPGQRNPLWAQRLKAQELLAAVRQYPSFPMVLETYRQALSDVFDLAAFKQLLADIRARRLRLDEVETPSASPFARSLVFAYVATYIYEQDAPLAERKAQALTLDRNLLAELLGQAELRELIDPATLEALEQELQHLSENHRARDADELHDLLRRLGDLSEAELAARSRGKFDVWILGLAHERRAALTTIGGERRWIAAEDAALYRDALGTVPPPGLPQAFLKPLAYPLEQLVRRYARTHGPFAARWLAQRYGLRPAEIESVLGALEAAGAVIRGEIRPGGAELDWCDTEVLRRLKRRTLAHLRHAVAPVEAQTLGRFLTAWHSIGENRQGPQHLLRSISQLQGLALPWSALRECILPSRVSGFSLDALDMLAAGGELAWVGYGALGTRDGRIALYLREGVGKLLEPTVRYEAASPLHAAILEHLRNKGASFLLEVEEAVRRAEPASTGDEFEAALWDLVWQGQITNDTFAPLRALARGRTRNQRGRWRAGQSLAGGRWSLVAELINPAVSPTERSVAWSHLLLERYGIVSREAAVGEAIPGGFAALYRVLSALEESGRIRRGYFVEALSGAQFAYAGAVDRLRGMRPPVDEDPASLTEKDVQMLAAVDPANPWGLLLPWPQSSAGAAPRPRRVAGAWVISIWGKPILYLGTNGGQLLTFPAMIRDERELELALRALHHVPRHTRRAGLMIKKVDGVAVRESVHFDRLRNCGFLPDYRGLTPCLS